VAADEEKAEKEEKELKKLVNGKAEP